MDYSITVLSLHQKLQNDHTVLIGRYIQGLFNQPLLSMADFQECQIYSSLCTKPFKMVTFEKILKYLELPLPEKKLELSSMTIS